MVAPSLYGYPGGHSVAADRIYTLIPFRLVQLEQQLSPGHSTESQLVDQIAQLSVGVRTRHDVHARCLFEQSLAQTLSHAPGNGENEIGMSPTVYLELPDSPQYPRLGMLTNRARVDHDDVGLSRIVDCHVPAPGQGSCHELGVGYVHLTAIGLDECAPRHGDQRRPPDRAFSFSPERYQTCHFVHVCSPCHKLEPLFNWISTA